MKELKAKKMQEREILFPIIEKEVVKEFTQYFTIDFKADLTTGTKISLTSSKEIKIPLKKNQSVIINDTFIRIPDMIIESLDWSQGDVISFDVVDERLEAVEIVKVAKTPEDIQKTVDAFRKGNEE